MGIGYRRGGPDRGQYEGERIRLGIGSQQTDKGMSRGVRDKDLITGILERVRGATGLQVTRKEEEE